MEITEDDIKGMIHNLEKGEGIGVYITIEFLKSKLQQSKIMEE